MANTFMSDLSRQRIPQVWTLYHPVSGDEITIVNDYSAAAMCKYLTKRDRGYELDVSVFLELDEDGDNVDQS
jgi:hypothetical protein